MKKPTLLICSCINVFAASKINNAELRRKQYENALLYSLKNYDLNHVIVVENTNTSWVSNEAQNLAKEKKIQLNEFLFNADRKMTDTHSIGYAHFEMVNHVFTRNGILNNGDSLLIMDGRYIIKNMNDILDHLNNGECAFIPEVHRLRKNNLCDMRLYMITKDIFMEHIWRNRYQLSLERSGWAESLLDRILKQKVFEYSALFTLPRIIGFQGSTGAAWDGNNFLKYHLKRLLVRWLNLLKY